MAEMIKTCKLIYLSMCRMPSENFSVSDVKRCVGKLF